LLTFYSNKSKQKSNVVYPQVLQNILVPELGNYFGEYLKTPVNKNTDLVYAALEAYLMLGDASHFQPDFISNTFQMIFPKSISTVDVSQLMSHVKSALKLHTQSLPLNNNLVIETQKYLISLPSFQLSYIILKNINNNNIENTVNLGITAKNSAFINHEVIYHIPQMFTAKAFPNIFSQETVVAAQESAKGNWILGDILEANNTNPDLTISLLQQLRDTYINNYVETWENLLGNVHLAESNDLAQTDAIITNLIATNATR
jgi:type VI secretion system protein ImpL